MTVYLFVLFVHVLSTLGIVVALSLETLWAVRLIGSTKSKWSARARACLRIGMSC